MVIIYDKKDKNVANLAAKFLQFNQHLISLDLCGIVVLVSLEPMLINWIPLAQMQYHATQRSAGSRRR